MPPRPKFDRFMVDVENGSNLKLARLTDAEYRVHFSGVLPVAAKSPIRGRLLISLSTPATVEDIAFQCRRPERLVRQTMTKLRELGIIIPDPEFDCEQVNDFEEWNPGPKRDTTAAERQRRRRAKLAAERDESVTVTPVSRRDMRDGHADVTGVKVEGEGEGEEAAAAVRAGAHPRLAEVLAILEPLPNMLTEPAAIDSALRAHPRKDHVAAAHTVASIVHGGQNRTAHTNGLLMSVLGRMDDEPDEAGRDVFDRGDELLAKAWKGEAA